MPEQTAMYHFTVSPPRGPGQDDVSTLLRQVADTLDALGAVTVHDITFHVDMTEDGSWPLMSVYYEVDVFDNAPPRRVDERSAAPEIGAAVSDTDDSIAVVHAPDDDIEVIESIDEIAVRDDHNVDAHTDADAFDGGEPRRDVADWASPAEVESDTSTDATAWAPTPPPAPPVRPAAYVDMISTFTTEPVGLHAVPASSNGSDNATERDFEAVTGSDVDERTAPLAEVVEIGTAAEQDGDGDEADDTTVEPAAAGTPDGEETSTPSFAPTFVTFDQTPREPAADADDQLPGRTSTAPPTPTYSPWRTQLPGDRTSLRRLKELWRTNSRRRND